LAAKKNYCKIPFRLISIEGEGYHIMVRVKINGSFANMLIDTGASKTVFDLTRIKGFLKDGKTDFEKYPQLSTGLGTSTLESHFTQIESFSIGNYKLKNYTAVLLDLAIINQSYKLLKITPIDGVIGSDMLVQLKAQINFPSKSMKLYPASVIKK
jgi:hypothetical protein